jgi:uncharacterized phage-associated protein
MSHLRLQKLLYYVQGWHLAVKQSPAFVERVEAWQHGPVVRETWDNFKKYGQNPIPFDEEAEDPNSVSEETKGFIRSVWEHYGKFSASALYRKTHNETPWLKTWGNRSSDEYSQDEIDQELMMSYFSFERERQEVPGLELESMAESEREFQQGGGRSLRQIGRDLGHEPASAF